MVPANLSGNTAPINPLKTSSKVSRASSVPSHLGHKPNLHACQGSIAIRMELAGLMSTEIIAHDSAMEDRLEEFLGAASPLLKQLQETLIAFGKEDIGVTH
ncbi:protein of unknown function [Nitrospira defluvii]|jgi:hypothetical protein|uniref:Uncharacterized protein n=1 Tax=Nitrospira defluvii TaxID=330214 RepID=D8P8R2_9BACT|nr:protein of unknown function [Nitrospira defluvii]